MRRRRRDDPVVRPGRLRSAIAAAGEWIREGRQVVLALLVGIDGSAPLEPGSAMLIAEDGAIEGSITGGCVEALVVGEAREVFARNPPRTVTCGDLGRAGARSWGP